VAFETDAVDDYFIREDSPGAWRVRIRQGDEYVDALDWSSTGPRSGIAQLWVNALPDGTHVGDGIEYLIEVTDDSRVDSIENRLFLNVVPEAAVGGGSGSRRSSGNQGKGSLGGPSQLSLPRIELVHEEDWERNDFDDGTALKVVLADSVYDFYVNVDNRYLRVAQKAAKGDPNLLEKQFTYGMVLVGLALLREQQEREKRRSQMEKNEYPSSKADDLAPEKFVAIATRALAPIFLPMMESIGGLALEEVG
jgi:hypothetical protein